MSWRGVAKFLRGLINRTLKLDVIPLYRADPLKTHLAKVIRAYRIDTVIDVGADEGHFGDLLRELGFKGEIHSFEPLKQSFERLSARAARDARWMAHNVALADKAGKGRMNVSRHSVLSSMLRANDYGTRLFDDMEVVREEEIDITTFDDFHDRFLGGTDRRILLKMDTQGYDLKVFEGAQRSLDSICCLLSELSLIPIYEGMPGYLEVLDAYARKNFSVSGIFPVVEVDDLSLVEVDCVLVNKAKYP